MSEQIWHRCDFPKCKESAAWVIKRPPQLPAQDANSIMFALTQQQQAPPYFEEFCEEHALALITDHEGFIITLKAASK